MRLVLDTAVIVTAFRSNKGASYALLQTVLDQRVELIATTSLLLEYEAVLKRPEQMRVHGYTHGEIDRSLSLLAAFAVQARQSYRWRPQLRDAADEHVLEAAVNGRAEVIVTFNTRDFLPAASHFGIKVAEPRAILKEEMGL